MLGPRGTVRIAKWVVVKAICATVLAATVNAAAWVALCAANREFGVLLARPYSALFQGVGWAVATASAAFITGGVGGAVSEITAHMPWAGWLIAGLYGVGSVATVAANLTRGVSGLRGLQAAFHGGVEPATPARPTAGRLRDEGGSWIGSLTGWAWRHRAVATSAASALAGYGGPLLDAVMDDHAPPPEPTLGRRPATPEPRVVAPLAAPVQSGIGAAAPPPIRRRVRRAAVAVDAAPAADCRSAGCEGDGTRARLGSPLSTHHLSAATVIAMPPRSVVPRSALAANVGSALVLTVGDMVTMVRLRQPSLLVQTRHATGRPALAVLRMVRTWTPPLALVSVSRVRGSQARRLRCCGAA